MNMFQGGNHLLTLQALGEMPFIQFPAQRKADRRRDAAPFAFHAPQDRTFAFRCPGAPERFLKRKSEFIEKDYVYAASPRFFLCGANLVPARRESALRHVRARVRVALADSSLTSGASDSNS